MTSEHRRHVQSTNAFHPNRLDVQVLKLIAKHKVIRLPWIMRLLKEDRRRVAARLKLLQIHRYLQCMRIREEKGALGGCVCWLQPRGLSSIRGTAADGTEGCRFQPGVEWLHRTLMTSDLMVYMEHEQSRHKRLLNDADLASSPGQPFRWSASLCNGKTLRIVPDKVFAFDCKQRDGSSSRLHYLALIDRPSLPITASDDKPSMLRKLQAYQLLNLRSGTFPPNCFVLIASDSESRLNRLIEAMVTAGLPRSLFKIACPAKTKLVAPQMNVPVNCRRPG